MWRWDTRGLVLTLLIALTAPAVFAQDFIGALDLPDATVTQSGEVLVKGWALDPTAISRIDLYVDEQFQYKVNQGYARIDIVEAFPNYPGIHNVPPGFQTGFNSARFGDGPHT